MLVSLVPIGNSKGIRIPKSIIDQLKIDDKLEMEIIEEKIVLKPVKANPRYNWEKVFKKMHANQDDELFVAEEIPDEDFQWEW